MGFDSTAIAMGLAASVVGKWGRDEKWTYGYGRIEVLAGFANAVALFFAAFGIIWEAVERLMTPETIHTDKLLLVAVLGLGVNLVGIFAFDHAALHGHGGHDHGHSHSHGSHSEHDHDHGGKAGTTANPLLHGMFLHILADTLGSVGVITSAILVDWFGWHWADPLCSLFIAVLILFSVWPLLRSSALTLLQRSPPSLDRSVPAATRQILSLPGVAGVEQLHVWELKTGHLVGTARVLLSGRGDAADGEMARVTREAGAVLRQLGCREVAVQVERGEPRENGYGGY
ncbi:cation efflux protein [Hyaloraphidium curvatum]|nr:cation efflux protein [Hyaloraphidium curvatum]